MNDFKFIAMDETKSETKVTGNIYLYDLFFMLIYFTVAAMLGTVVSSTLRIAYYAFNVFCPIIISAKCVQQFIRSVWKIFGMTMTK